MAEPRNESQLTAQIVRDVTKKYPGVWHLKVHGDGYQRVGVPDLLFSVGGRLLAVEVKHRKPGESLDHLYSRVSTVQRAEIDRLRESGAEAIVAWDPEQVLVAVEVVLSGGRIEERASWPL